MWKELAFLFIVNQFSCFRCLNKYIGNRCEMIDPEIIFDQSASKIYITHLGNIVYQTLEYEWQRHGNSYI